jgi:hypothetical protein
MLMYPLLLDTHYDLPCSHTINDPSTIPFSGGNLCLFPARYLDLGRLSGAVGSLLRIAEFSNLVKGSD